LRNRHRGKKKKKEKKFRGEKGVPGAIIDKFSEPRVSRFVVANRGEKGGPVGKSSKKEKNSKKLSKKKRIRERRLHLKGEGGGRKGTKTY